MRRRPGRPPPHNGSPGYSTTAWLAHRCKLLGGHLPASVHLRIVCPQLIVPGDSDVIPGVDSDPPGGFVNFLKKSTSRPAQVVSNESSSQPINVGDDNNGGDDARTEKRLLWTKEEDLRLVSAWLNNSNDPVQANYKKNDTFWKMLPLFSTAPPPKIGGG